MSESDTMFNERDRRCSAVQHMLSTDPSYDKRIIASTLQIKDYTTDETIHLFTKIYREWSFDLNVNIS